MRRYHHSLWEQFCSLFTPVLPYEGRIVALLTAQSFILLLAYYPLRVIRDALILTQGGAEIKSYSNALTSALLLGVVPLYAYFYRHYSRYDDRSLMARHINLFFAVNLMLFAAAGFAGWRVSIPFYVWLGVYSVMVVAHFWSFAADLLNVKTGQRLFVMIMIGANVGAFLGTRLADNLFRIIGPYGLMLLTSGLLLTLLPLARLSPSAVPQSSRNLHVVEADDSASASQRSVLHGFRVVLQNRYLLLIAVFIVVTNWLSSSSDYIFSKFLEHGYEVAVQSDPGLKKGVFYASWFARLGGYFTIFGFLCQMFLVSRIFRWVGIKGALYVLPLAGAIGFALIVGLQTVAVVFWTLVLLRGLEYSLQNTTRQALFLPVTREEKYVGKTTIDTFFWRFGDLVSSITVFVGTQVWVWALSDFVALNLALGVLSIAIVWRLGARHGEMVDKHLDNAVPIVAVPLPNVSVVAGQTFQHILEEGTFVDPDAGDALVLQATALDGSSLPRWIRFDRLHHTFTFTPPPRSSGVIDIQVVARDVDGSEARSQFRLEWE